MVRAVRTTVARIDETPVVVYSIYKCHDLHGFHFFCTCSHHSPGVNRTMCAHAGVAQGPRPVARRGTRVCALGSQILLFTPVEQQKDFRPRIENMVWPFVSSRASRGDAPATPTPGALQAQQRLNASGYSPTGVATPAANGSQRNNAPQPTANIGAVRQHSAVSRKAADARATTNHPNCARERSTRVQGVMQRPSSSSQPSRVAPELSAASSLAPTSELTAIPATAPTTLSRGRSGYIPSGAAQSSSGGGSSSSGYCCSIDSASKPQASAGIFDLFLGAASSSSPPPATTSSGGPVVENGDETNGGNNSRLSTATAVRRVASQVKVSKQLAAAQRDRLSRESSDPARLWALLAGCEGAAVEGTGLLRGAALIRASWLVDAAHKDPERFRLPPHGGTLPTDAVISASELKEIHFRMNLASGGMSALVGLVGGSVTFPLIALSHFWRRNGVNDVDGLAARLVVRALEASWESFGVAGLHELGVFVEWCHIPPDPSSKRLDATSLWYSHRGVVSWVITEPRPEVKAAPTRTSGWGKVRTSAGENSHHHLSATPEQTVVQDSGRRGLVEMRHAGFGQYTQTRMWAAGGGDDEDDDDETSHSVVTAVPRGSAVAAPGAAAAAEGLHLEDAGGGVPSPLGVSFTLADVLKGLEEATEEATEEVEVGDASEERIA